MVRCFESRKDRFSCVSVDFFVDELESTDDLDDCLSVSISKWKEDGVSGVWLKIPLEKSDYIAVCVKHSFQYHHALPGHVVMQRWLPEDRPSTLPPYAFHHVAAAGLVVNQREEILVVKENFYPDCKWKLPGGSCDPGEDLGDTAIREVYEETGVRTEFVALLAFRHMHKFRFGSSDIYFVCVLRPTTHTIRRDSREIKDARWMHPDPNEDVHIDPDNSMSVDNEESLSIPEDTNMQAETLNFTLPTSATDEQDNAPLPVSTNDADQSSFDVSIDHDIVQDICEEPLNDRSLPNDIGSLMQTDDSVTSYTIVVGGSQKGKDLLIDNLGYSYTNPMTGRTSWICSVHNKLLKYGAMVSQKNQDFIKGAKGHGHPPVPGKVKQTLMVSEARENALSNIFCPTPHIVENVMLNHHNESDPLNSIPRPSTLVQYVN